MKKSKPKSLITTRFRATVATCFAALVLVMAVRKALSFGNTQHTWLLQEWFLWLHGWGLIAANVVLYAYMDFLAFSFTFGTAGRERAYMAGWAVAFLLMPMKHLLPSWSSAFYSIEVAALLFSFAIALSLLQHPSRADPSEETMPSSS